MAFLVSLYRYTLGSVIFGISLMVLLAAYIAVGSGLPAVREAFEMNEMQFFNAWPMLVLSILLCLNLICVTVERIPLTPPRYGVWTIHMGVVVLVMGMVFYYTMKTEGLAIVFQGRATAHYYDMHQRALFLRLNTPAGAYQLEPKPLANLPRFKVHDSNSRRMAAEGLRGLVPMIRWPNSQTGEFETLTVAEKFKLPSDLHIDLLAYYPHATIESRPVQTGAPDKTAIELIIHDPHADMPGHGADDGHDHGVITRWISADEPTRRMTPMALGMAEHRAVDDAHIDEIIAAARSMHRLEVTVAGQSLTLTADVGQTYPVGDTGYTIKVESFTPNWPTIDGKQVPALTLHVTSPTQEFKRMVLADRPEPTDFKLGVEGAGPMGQRQQKPLDEDLKTTYSFNDDHHLTSREGGLWLVLTSPKRMVLILVPGEGPVRVHETTGKQQEFMLGGHVGVPLPVVARRHDGTELVDRIVEIPPEQRRRDEAGMRQVVLARVTMGDWSREVAVPFSRWAMEAPWQGGAVPLEGTPLVLQMQLGNTPLQMPARVTLDRFELVNYMGGTPQTTNLFRDFKSHLTIVDRQTGQKREAVAHMNNPVYFGGLGDSYWTLFQAEWDPEGQRYTVLGVGNRPGVWVMTLGCVMICVGLLWAFYLKPILIRRMKQKALAQAQAAGKLPKPARTPELAQA